MENHDFTSAECSAFKAFVAKAVKRAVGESARHVGLCVSGRKFEDGSCGIGLIVFNTHGQEFTLITKTPPELQGELKARYRLLLSSMSKA